MKKGFTKIISFVLCFAMLLSCGSVVSFEAEESGV